MGRRRRTGAVGVLLAATSLLWGPALPAGAQDADDFHRYRSRTDLPIPAIEVTTHEAGTAPGLNFVDVRVPAGSPGRDGRLIYDLDGEPVSFRPGTPRNYHPLTWFGQQAAAWFDPRTREWVVEDASYRELARLRAGNGHVADEHDLDVSPDGRALLVVYHAVTVDLTPYGGRADATVIEGVVQEIDARTGEILFEWRSLGDDGIPITDTYVALDAPRVDYLHINSVAYDVDGDILVSARNTSEVIKIDRDSGEVLWRLGGKSSSFALVGDDGPSWPHDARRRPDGTVSVFDNGVGRSPNYSRGVAWRLDEDAGTATLVAEWRPEPDLYTAVVGSNRALPNGNTLASFGTTGQAIEWRDGEVVWTSRMPGSLWTYRTVRGSWQGAPVEPPVAVAERTGSTVTAWATWNGATEVAGWELLAGPDPGSLRVVGAAPRSGFETQVSGAVGAADDVVALRAVGGGGTGLGTSVPLTLAAGSPDAVVAFRGRDDTVVTRALHDGVWSSPHSRGGIVTAEPDATVLSDGTQLIVARGAPDGLYARFVDGDAVSRWYPLGGQLTSGPSVTPGPGATALVTVCGADGDVWATTLLRDGRRTGWRWLGGDCRGGGTGVTRAADGTVVLASVAADRSVRVATTGADLVGRWRSLGGVVTGAPELTARPAGDAVVSVRGIHGPTYQQQLDPRRGWAGSGWRNLGGDTTPARSPSTVIDDRGALRLLVHGVDEWVFERVDPVGSGGWRRLWPL